MEYETQNESNGQPEENGEQYTSSIPSVGDAPVGYTPRASEQRAERAERAERRAEAVENGVRNGDGVGVDVEEAVYAEKGHINLRGDKRQQTG